MPDHYFRAFGVEEIVAHLELFRSFWRNIYLRDEPATAPALRWEAQPEQGHSVVSICTWDRLQLLASIAGAFAVASVNILSADIFIRGDNLVLDVFRVCNKKLRAGDRPARNRDRRIGPAHRFGRRALRFRSAAGERPPQRLKTRSPEIDFPTRITIENKSHPTSTLIQVETPDRLGLLYDLVSCLGRNNVYITLSRINTDKGAAIDTFYVDRRHHARKNHGRETDRSAAVGITRSDRAPRA